MIDRARESRNPKKVIRVTLMESYGEIGRVPVNLYRIEDMDNLNTIVVNYRNSRYQSQTVQAFISIVREVLSNTL